MDAARCTHTAAALGESAASHCGHRSAAQCDYAGDSTFHLAAIVSLADGENYCIAAVYRAGHDSDQTRQDTKNQTGRLALRTAGFYLHRGRGANAQPTAMANTLKTALTQIETI